MAIFNPANGGNNGNNNDDSWRKDAWINIELPDDEGTFKKAGAIGLKLSKAADRELIEFCKAHPDYVQTLFEGARFNFQMSDGSTSRSFALPEVDAA